MTLQGIVQNGVVVLPQDAGLADGTPVTVQVGPSDSATAIAAAEARWTEKEKQRVLAIIKRIASLPDENPGDTFSGADHDQVLYGKP